MQSLNLEYIFSRVYEIVTGAHVDIASIPRYVIIIVGDITIIGMVLAIVLFVIVVYFQIRTVQVEHEGYRQREEEKKRRQASAEKTGVDTRWDTIVELASSSQEGDWRRAIIEADAMLEEILSSRGYTGESTGEKLKQANPLQFTTIDLAWQAHKMRNAIAHLGEAFPLTQRDTQATIDLYRRVFEEFGVL